ncbi:hypothetical protein UPYG_G00036530 [Umbra pygmaea]|uniref:Urotensin-2B n=1 Tax=Umbra pygmaea TaxID=75934 RepID=A0ABD0XP10_UMBPY
MGRFVFVNFWLVLLAILHLQGVFGAEGRSLFNPETHVYHPREGTNVQHKILALLLHNSLVPERKDTLGLELAKKLAEVGELEALKDDLDVERELSSHALLKDKTSARKRNEPCFWKYCV